MIFILPSLALRLTLNEVIKKEKEILSEINENYEKHIHQRLIDLLELDHGNSGYYRLNSLIETVIKKVEFADRFNFETV